VLVIITKIIRGQDALSKGRRRAAGRLTSLGAVQPNRPWQEEKKHTSPLRKLISIFLGMCKTQRDIEVAQQDERKKNKKMMDTMKALHNQAGYQPPRSPISPSPPEVEIPSVDDRVNAFINSDLYNQYGSNFGSDIGASSSSAPPPPPPTSFDSMFEGDTTAPPPWVPPPSTDEWAARVSHEFFDQPALPMVWKIHSCLYF
jgi:hypothetical protein